jgi:hypothetical protein
VTGRAAVVLGMEMKIRNIAEVIAQLTRASKGGAHGSERCLQSRLQ